MSFFSNEDNTNNQGNTPTGETAPTGNESPFFQVGDRVFRTKEDLEKHINSAQEHIRKLETDFENASKLITAQDQQLLTSRKIDELLNAVATKQSTSEQPQVTPQFSEEDVINKAIQTFEQRQIAMTQMQREEQNYNTVQQALRQAFGEKANEVVLKVTSDLGLSNEEAVEYAKRHPKAFLKFFDTKPTSGVQPNVSTVNTQVVADVHGKRPFKSILKMSSKERAAEIQRRLAELN